MKNIFATSILFGLFSAVFVVSAGAQPVNEDLSAGITQVSASTTDSLVKTHLSSCEMPWPDPKTGRGPYGK